MSRIINGGGDSGGGSGGGGFVWNPYLVIQDTAASATKTYSSQHLTNGTADLHVNTLEVNTLDIVTTFTSSDPIADLGTAGVAAPQGGVRILTPSGAAPNALLVWDNASQTVQAGPEGATRALGYADEHGDVEGPASSIDNALARFDLTTGKVIQNSNSTLSDDGDLVVERNIVGDQIKVGPTRASDTVGSVADVHVQSTVNGTSTVWLETDATNSDAPEKGEALLLFSADANSHQYEVKVDNTTSNELQFRGVNYLGGGTMGFYLGDTVNLTPGAGSRGTITRAGTKRFGIGGDGAELDTVVAINPGDGVRFKLGTLVKILDSSVSADASTGALVVTGGVGVGENVSVGGALVVDTINELTPGGGVNIADTLKAQFAEHDVVQEFTADTGVTVDGVLLKDGAVYGQTNALGVTPSTFQARQTSLGTGYPDYVALRAGHGTSDGYVTVNSYDAGSGAHTTIGAVNVAGSANVPLCIWSGSPLVVESATASTTTTTGALTVAGGAGIAGALNVGTTAVVNSTTMAAANGTANTSGAVNLLGGIGGRNFFFRNNDTSTNYCQIEKGAGAGGWIGLTVGNSNTSHTKVVMGYLTSANGALVGAHNYNLNAWADLHLGANASGSNLYLQGIDVACTATAGFRISSTTASSTTTTGALRVAGGAGIAGALNAGSITAGSTIVAGGSISSGSTITATVSVLTDSIAERTLGEGVNVDGVKCKDSGVSFDGGFTYLSNYTVGTWTPTFTGAINANTFVLTFANYSRIGRVVTFELGWTCTTPGAADADTLVRFTLPVSGATANATIGSGMMNYWKPTIVYANSAGQADVYAASGGANAAGTSEMHASGSYQIV